MKKNIFVLLPFVLIMLFTSCNNFNLSLLEQLQENAVPMYSYTVEHYLQNAADSDYTIKSTDTQTKYGKKDAATKAKAKSYAGFTAQVIVQGIVAVDGSTVVKVYYDRNTITLTFDLDGGT